MRTKIGDGVGGEQGRAVGSGELVERGRIRGQDEAGGGGGGQGKIRGGKVGADEGGRERKRGMVGGRAQSWKLVTLGEGGKEER